VHSTTTTTTGTPLHSAVRRKSLDHVRRLVESGAHVDAAEVDPTTTPLLIAAFSHQVETASYLLAKGADVRVFVTIPRPLHVSA
jgi:ankyrin repeat protein